MTVRIVIARSLATRQSRKSWGMDRHGLKGLAMTKASVLNSGKINRLGFLSVIGVTYVYQLP